ncbi:MAG: hypothetical protein A3G25_13295 [Betaproteobacteria bacterium RIFCSPLOWO2_12_FULL_63_13]|nr:MAG: hypothetical protein A3H32_07005 [Betaproteobacteria bacterium RIFCSPLOWO2_02_FULL_63_19]OGA42832.1 MAG: hypothetical protein A3G25_13295 [Betaproteobacteria bacterium RIFCSPLOWO2_12_FULL_63_13]
MHVKYARKPIMVSRCISCGIVQEARRPSRGNEDAKTDAPEFVQKNIPAAGGSKTLGGQLPASGFYGIQMPVSAVRAARSVPARGVAYSNP